MILCKFCYTDITKEEGYVSCCAQRELITQSASEESVVTDKDVEIFSKYAKVEVTDDEH